MLSRSIGNAGEKAACKYLKKQGYKILECNYKHFSGKMVGEIDIIARREDTVSFIEVKTRKNSDFGLPCEAVTKSKQQKIIHTAYTYIMEHNLSENYSFDIIEVFHDEKKIVFVRHIPNAFTL